MFINKKTLAVLIEAEVERFLIEQEEPETPEPATEPEVDTDTNADEVSPDDEELDLETGDDAPEGTEADEGLEGLEGEEAGDDLGGIGGPGFAAGGGGGFDFGDEGETGLSPDEQGEEETAITVGPEDVEIPADPVMAITDDAVQMLNKTKQPNAILKNVKHSVQRYFPDPMDATPIIKNLWDTEDLVLRDVARRLLLFIKGI